jgi:hypothetical protein
VFAAAVLIAAGMLVAPAQVFPANMALALISSFAFAAAGLIALATWRRRHAPSREHVTYWDVAGALTLIGITAGALIDPHELVQLVHGPAREH